VGHSLCLRLLGRCPGFFCLGLPTGIMSWVSGVVRQAGAGRGAVSAGLLLFCLSMQLLATLPGPSQLACPPPHVLANALLCMPHPPSYAGHRFPLYDQNKLNLVGPRALCPSLHVLRGKNINRDHQCCMQQVPVMCAVRIKDTCVAPGQVNRLCRRGLPKKGARPSIPHTAGMSTQHGQRCGTGASMRP